MRTLLCVAFLALTAAVPLRGSSLLDLAVIDRDTGETLRTYPDHGKLYIASTPGHRYSVRLSNLSAGRVEAVLSVDGVNAVTGEAAGPTQVGYVLNAGQSWEVAGWRKSDDEVAQFNFTALLDSYAARTGRPANVGVIGVAVYAEHVPFWRKWRNPARRQAKEPLDRSDTGTDGRLQDLTVSPVDKELAPSSVEKATSADAPNGQTFGRSQGVAGAPSTTPPLGNKEGSVSLSGKRERLGTGHGAREYSHVDHTTFDRASPLPAEQHAIYYDSRENLVAQDIIEPADVRQDPQPFPSGYVPDPPTR